MFKGDCERIIVFARVDGGCLHKVIIEEQSFSQGHLAGDIYECHTHLYEPNTNLRKPPPQMVTFKSYLCRR